MRLQQTLQEWNANIFGDVGAAVKRAEAEMMECQNTYDLQGGVDAQFKWSEATAKHARQLALEAEYWRQKSSIKWIQAGGTNTIFFSMQ